MSDYGSNSFGVKTISEIVGNPQDSGCERRPAAQFKVWTYVKIIRHINKPAKMSPDREKIFATVLVSGQVC